MRWVCWLFGHRWVFLFGSYMKAMALAHLSSVAGEDHFCVRCGSFWEDAEPQDRAKFYSGVKPNWSNYPGVRPEDWSNHELH
jgi:hypothetical protein